MVKQKTINKTMLEVNRNIKTIQHETVENLLAAEYNISIKKLKLCKHGGVDENGNEWEMDFDEIITAIKRMGCYGFTDNKTNIHVWISKKADPTDIINLLAHERGHLIKPNHRNLVKEEMKAEMYGLCAEFAYRTFLDLAIK